MLNLSRLCTLSIMYSVHCTVYLGSTYHEDKEQDVRCTEGRGVQEHAVLQDGVQELPAVRIHGQDAVHAVQREQE